MRFGTVRPRVQTRAPDHSVPRGEVSPRLPGDLPADPPVGRLLVDRAAGRPICIPAGWVGGRGTCSLADPSSAEPPMRTLLDGCQDRRERPQRVS